jgi:very-short-patch-repair endonuclease
MLRDVCTPRVAAHKKARRLRRDMTKPEKLLWILLRAKRLRGWKFRRQVPLGPYIADFCCVQERLVVEVDGPIHNSLRQRLHDRRRTRFLEEHGFRVIRFTNDQVLSEYEDVLHAITDFLLSFPTSPSP